ncbi:MAG TPA: M48 family metalloprotease, partial [Caulobacter sp.]|nr:M48 family metalloprotease [Caulobacter sp.]
MQALFTEDAIGASKTTKPRAAAAAAAPALPPDPVAPNVAMDNDLTKELARGTLLAQLEGKGRLSKLSYEPPPKLLLPYQAGSLNPAVAFELIESGRQFVDAPAAEAYAQQIVDRLLSKVPESRLALRVKIIADPSYGAYATDTGLILVRLGTFNADATKGAATADELALLLGHEIGHILMGHVEGRKQMRDLSRLISYSATAALTYSAVKDGKMINGQFQGKPDKDMMVKSLLAGLTTSTLVEELLSPSFNRQRELEADRIGIDLARRAGYVIAEGEVLRFVSKHGEDALRRSRRLEVLREVIDLAVAQVAAKATKESGSNGQLIKDLITVPSKMMSEQIVRLVVRQTKEHPDPDERMAFVARYVKQNYGEGDTGPDGRILKRDAAGMSAVCREPGLSALVTQVRRANDVKFLLVETKPSEDAAVQAQQAKQVL